jgi:hypothetical protein
MHKYISQISHVKTLQQNSDAEYTAFMILQSAVNNLDFRGVGGGAIKIVVENWVAKTKRLRNAALK